MMERLRALRQAWDLTRANDPRMPAIVLGSGAGVLAAFVVLGIVLGGWYWYVFGVLLGLTLMLVLFGRRTQSVQYAQIEGRPGAAAAVLESMRGQWFVSPAVAFSKKQDLVHRVVGRCGIVLVGEGSPPRVKQLMSKEKTRLTRIAGDVSIHTMIVGEGDKQVSLQRLQVAMNKLSRELKKTEVPKLERKLKPLDRDLPIPKGYLPNPGKKMR
jgi:hypothetical protein